MTLKGGCIFLTVDLEVGFRIVEKSIVNNQSTLKFVIYIFFHLLLFYHKNGRQFETYIDTMVSERAIKPEY